MPRTKNNAFLNRIHVRAWLSAAFVGGFSITAQAGYAQLSPPSGFSGSAGDWKFAPSANDTRYGKVAFQPNALRVPVSGSSATMPVAYRFAANAPRIAAAAIYLNPYVRVGVGIAAWLGAGLVWDELNKRWQSQDLVDAVQSDGFEYNTGGLAEGVGYHSDSKKACLAYVGNVSGAPGATQRRYITSTDTECRFEVFYFNTSGTRLTINANAGQFTSRRGSSCPSGWYVTSAGCVQTPPLKTLTQPEFVEKLAPIPMPDSVPFELPRPTPLPVEQPVINPEPGTNPQPRPLFVPTGDPVPNPNYDPNAAPGPNNQPWMQPGVRVTPSPTQSEPWRVDVQPVNRPQAGPEPLPDSQPDPENPDKPKPEEQQSLCEKHPDILACQKPDLDTPEGEIPKSNKDVSLQEENLFGGGSCPADLYFTPHGLQQLKVWDWNNACGYITGYVKPILIICCTFAAFMILIPGRTE